MPHLVPLWRAALLTRRADGQTGQVDGTRELMQLTRVEAVRAMRAGQLAARHGQPATTCPFSPNGDATERVAVQAWLRGFLGGA
jgi:hypothetical protein